MTNIYLFWKKNFISIYNGKDHMFTYKAFGLELSSALNLPGMIQGSGNPDVKILLSEVDPTLVLDAEVEGPNYLVKGQDVYLWWDDIGKVKISGGKQVTVEVIADLDDSTKINIIPFLLGPGDVTFIASTWFSSPARKFS